MSERELFQQWAQTAASHIPYLWNDKVLRYQHYTADLMFQAFLQGLATAHLVTRPSRKRKVQKPFSPAVKERLAKRYRQRQDERFQDYVPHLRESILAGRTLREMAQELPFGSSAIHKYILRHEELSKLWTGEK